MPKYTGICRVKANGALLESKEGASIDIGGFERTPAKANGRVVGFHEKPREASVEATILHRGETDLIALRDFVDGDVEFITDTGVTYVINGAWVAEPPKLTGGEGEVSVKFQGPPAEQQ